MSSNELEKRGFSRLSRIAFVASQGWRIPLEFDHCFLAKDCAHGSAPICAGKAGSLELHSSMMMMMMIMMRIELDVE